MRQNSLVSSRRVGPCELSIMLLSDSATAVSRTCTSESRVQRSNHYFFTLLPRDALLARYMLSSRVRLSVCHKLVLYRNDRTNRAGFGTGTSFHQSHTVIRKYGYLQKIRALSTATLSQTPDLENVAAASQSRCQQHSLLSSTVEFVDDTYTTINESWLFTTNRSTVTLELHYFDLLYKLFLQLTRFRLT